MEPLFAHHDMLDSLDFLRLNPVTPLDHTLVFAIYATLAVVAFLGSRWALRRGSRRSRTGRIAPPTPAITGPRTAES